MKRLILFMAFLVNTLIAFSQTDSSGIKVDAEIWARNRKDAFKNTANDSLFVASNSDASFGYSIYNRTQDLGGMEFLFFSSTVGEVMGPIYSNGYAMLLKVIRYDSTYRVRLSQILLYPSGKSKKDSLATFKKGEKYLAELKAGKDFGKMVKDVSQDTTSSKSGGDIGWFFYGTMGKDINDFIRNGKKGDKAVIKTYEGTHIFIITEEKVKDRFRVILLPLVKKL